jgi:hypothetical protein
MISAVTPEQLEMVWPHFLPWVEKGLRHGQGDSLAPCDIYHGIASGQMSFWVAHKNEKLSGGMVLEVNQHPRAKVVFVVLLVGENFDEWVDEMEAALMNYRDINGADSIQASCRKGMVKKLMQRGWKQKAVIMESP